MGTAKAEIGGRMQAVEAMYKRAADELKSAEALLITAGAGMGVDSGLPDFRGNEGFWRAYPPIKKLGISFSEMANPGWFERDPGLAWGFYGHRLSLYRRTVPHEGFSLLLEMAEQKPDGCFVFTSNVDGQFQRAGFSEEKIEECHGSIHHCIGDCNSQIWEATDTAVDVDEETMRARGRLPTCISCGKLARPNILMFGDWGWSAHRSQQQAARLSGWLDEILEAGKKLAVVEIGAGKAVPTVRLQSEEVARTHSTSLIRINPRDFDVPSAKDIGLAVGSETGIRRIAEKMPDPLNL